MWPRSRFFWDAVSLRYSEHVHEMLTSSSLGHDVCRVAYFYFGKPLQGLLGTFTAQGYLDGWRLKLQWLGIWNKHVSRSLCFLFLSPFLLVNSIIISSYGSMEFMRKVHTDWVMYPPLPPFSTCLPSLENKYLHFHNCHQCIFRWSFVNVYPM